MNIETYIPTALLKPFIRNYRVIEHQEESVNRVLPDTSLVIAFRFKGQVNYIESENIKPLPIAVISGLRKTVRLINYVKNTGTVIISFKEAGAMAFFKEPLHELFEQSISLDNFISSQEISDIEEQLSETKFNFQRIAIVEHFLLSKLVNPKFDQLVEHAVQKISSANGILKIRELAGNLYISQDAFEKRFRKAIGTSPKQFASIIRMKSAIHQIHKTKTFTSVALDSGYFDQPHFNKDFKLFTGQTPSDFFSSASFW